MRFLRRSYIRIRVLTDASLMCTPVGSHQDFMPIGPIDKTALRVFIEAGAHFSSEIFHHKNLQKNETWPKRNLLKPNGYFLMCG
jgi:hypothetical protein